MLAFGILLLFSTLWTISKIPLLLDGSACKIHSPYQRGFLEKEAIIVETYDVIITLFGLLIK